MACRLVGAKPVWTNAGILLIEPLGTNFNEISIETHTFSFKKMHLKMLSGKCRPFCLGLNVLRVGDTHLHCRRRNSPIFVGGGGHSPPVFLPFDVVSSSGHPRVFWRLMLLLFKKVKSRLMKWCMPYVIYFIRLMSSLYQNSCLSNFHPKYK